MHSSMGFHTLSLFLRLSCEEVQVLIEHFCAYRKCTGLIRIRMNEVLPSGQREWREYKPLYSGSQLVLPIELKISYWDKNLDRGIRWTIRSDRMNEGYKEYTVKATINPKILIGIQDYLTAATEDDLKESITYFNIISNKISPVLKTFEQYTLQRIDYCINFSLDELAPSCSYEQMITLIKRSDIPPHFNELSEYDPISHRMKSKPGSFYLMNGSVHVNCYSKYMSYQEQSKRNIENGYPPIPHATMDASRDIIRFEVQCKYRKVYALSRKGKPLEGTTANQYQQLLTHEYCNDIIYNYYKKAIGMGDWYTLHDAIKMVRLYHFNSQKEKRLIEALQFVNECRSIPSAKSAYRDRDLMAFNRTLADLNSMGINPVTIPREWGIRHIPNLLNAYFDKISEEKTKKEIEEFKMECLNEYLRHGY